MRDPCICLRKAVQEFASYLNNEDKQKSEQVYNERSIETLEREIDMWRDKLPDSVFYFHAGRCFQSVLDDVFENDGNDAMNASSNGLSAYGDFIIGNEDW